MEKELIMKPEYKQLLLLDLCARLPYGVKAQYYGSEEKMLTVDTIEAIYIQPSVEIVIGQYGLELDDIKPYLRPMSSMTEEEREEYEKTLEIEYQDMLPEPIYHKTLDSYYYLLEHHFDFLGLIPAGFAIAVTEENFYVDGDFTS